MLASYTIRQQNAMAQNENQISFFLFAMQQEMLINRKIYYVSTVWGACPISRGSPYETHNIGWHIPIFKSSWANMSMQN